ncbi:MAG: DNA polymerase III subunit gamma/tau [Flavobacteriales bacterium]|jgi:DNA polymerase-3 subunit gamma/tau|nr:DNA polymerase III subunit gamma/tau [Flavobacteriales bacterium]
MAEESFVVSARKYRPDSFTSVLGQEAITRTLENAISSNHLAQSFLFCGPRGVGKTTCARILAKRINTVPGTELDGHDFAFNIFELDAASNNTVDDIRNLIDQVRIPPQVGKYRVYIIDEVHMLSSAAFNAFLKTLEEPPAHAIFILATTEKHKILPTILSRCQVFDFKRIEIRDIIKQLEIICEREGVEAEHDALLVIAQKADGAMRDALSIFDQMVTFSGMRLTYKDVIENLNVLDQDYYFRLVDSISTSDIPACLLLLEDVLANGFDLHQFVSGAAEHLRHLLICKEPATLPLLHVGEGVKERFVKQSSGLSLRFIVDALSILTKCDINFKSSRNPRLLVEVSLMQLCSVQPLAEKKKSLM